jgi:hypothetical protein
MSNRNWSSMSDLPLSKSALRAFYPVADGYTLCENGYDARAHFTGSTSLPSTVFVLNGAISYEVGGNVVAIEGGEFAELPAGSYKCDVGIQSVRFFQVIRLPEQYRQLAQTKGRYQNRNDAVQPPDG